MGTFSQLQTISCLHISGKTALELESGNIGFIAGDSGEVWLTEGKYH